MAAFYYLISTLPMLSCGEVPMLTCDEFLAACTEFVSNKEMQDLQELTLVPPEEYDGNNPTAYAWYEWETCLRNALVQLRTKGKGPEGEKFLREETNFFSEIPKGVQEAFNKTSPLEMEDALDKVRWSKLNDMEVGHSFDFAILCVYKLKLMLGEKQRLLDEDQGSGNYDAIVDHIYGKATVAPKQIEA